MPKTLVYFVSDLHGSSMCFRKFVNSTKVYKPSVLILGGDVAGKAIQSIVKAPGGRYQCEFVGTRYDLSDEAELQDLERLIADHGYYPYRAEPGELEAMEADGTLDELFLRLMRERLAEWLEIADTRLRPQNVPLFLMLGNDDPPELAELLDQAPWGTHAEGKVVHLDDDHEMISWGYANTTPWHTYREQDEQQLAEAYQRMAAQLDDAPALDDELRVQATLGQIQYRAVGSTAVKDIETQYQPLLGLHGHIHESSGIRRVGPRKSMVINPGSDYSTGALNGALITLDRDKAGAQLVRG